MFVKGNWHLQFSVTVSIQIDIKWFKKSYKFSCPHSSVHIKSTVSSSDKEGDAKSPGVPYRKWKLTTPWMPALMLCIVYMYHAPPLFGGGGRGGIWKKIGNGCIITASCSLSPRFRSFLWLFYKSFVRINCINALNRLRSFHWESKLNPILFYKR